MRLLWISFLLIGSVTCVPKQGGTGGGPVWQYRALPSGQDPVPQSPGGGDSGAIIYTYYPGLQSSNAGGDDGGFTQGTQHGSQQGAPGDSYQYEESWGSSSDPSDGHEPVFTNVDDRDQVYGYKSKSKYDRKQLRFSQFYYSPLVPVVNQPPVFPHPGKNPHDPVKRGY